MVLVDAAVDEADGHPRTRLGGLSLHRLDIAVGDIRVDGAQSPLAPRRYRCGRAAAPPAATATATAGEGDNKQDEEKDIVH